MKPSIFTVLLALLLFSQSALAETMNCAGGLVRDKQRQMMTSDQVISRCGDPDSKEGATWLYKKGSHDYRLLFNANGELYAIHKRRSK